MDGLVRSLLTGAEHVGNKIMDSTEADVDEGLASALDIPADQGTVAHVMSIVEVDGRPMGSAIPTSLRTSPARC